MAQEVLQVVSPSPPPSCASSLVMSNPNSYPDVFLEIMLAVRLDPKQLANFARVNRAWRHFIGGYLWKSQRVQTLIARNWFGGMPSLIEVSNATSVNASSTFSNGIRCLAGDLVYIFAGTYKGTINVFPAVPISKRGRWDRWGKIATLSKGHQVHIRETKFFNMAFHARSVFRVPSFV